jgi:hypothetical protein
VRRGCATRACWTGDAPDAPTSLFVPESHRLYAYTDHALPIGEGQTISQPSLVGQMTQLLELTGDENVLEIGTGSGYQTAILRRLCGRLTTIERFPRLTLQALRNLQSLNLPPDYLRNWRRHLRVPARMRRMTASWSRRARRLKSRSPCSTNSAPTGVNFCCR